MKRIAISLLLLFALTACVKEPYETQNVVDNRPQIAFKMQSKPRGKSNPKAYEVYVDDLYMGRAHDYKAGKRALRVLSGTHVVKVEKMGNVVLTQRVYVGDGVTKTILIP